MSKKQDELVKGWKQGKAQFKKARLLFWDMRNRLMLQNYTLTFDKKPPKGKTVAATIYVSNTRSVAHIQIGDLFYNASAENQRHYAVHELLHIFLARLDYLASDAKHHMSPQAYSIWYTSMHRELERAIDALADVIAPYTLMQDAMDAKPEKRESKSSD